MNVARFQALVLAIVASVCTVANPMHAREPIPQSESTASEPLAECQDPAFERFVDGRLIGPAITGRDAVLLTDLAR